MIVAHQFGAGFSKMKWLGVFFLPEWDMLDHLPIWQYPFIYLGQVVQSPIKLTQD